MRTDRGKGGHSESGRIAKSVRDIMLIVTLLDLCVSSLRRGHANLLRIVPILKDDPRRESDNNDNYNDNDDILINGNINDVGRNDFNLLSLLICINRNKETMQM